MNRRLKIACFTITVVCQLGGVAGAQKFHISAQRGPYYVGEPVVVQVIAEGFTSGNQPVCRLQNEPPPALTIEGPRMNVSKRSFTQIINGRMSRTDSVDYGFSFVVTASQEGEFVIGPFQVDYDRKSRIIEGPTFRFRRLDNDPDMRIELSLPGPTFYVGQRIPVTIRWAFAGELETVRYALSKLQIRSPLFEQFTFQDQPPTTRTTLAIATAKGTIQVDAEVTRVQQAGREFIVVTGRRTMLADTVGDFDSIPVTCRTEKVTAWGRDLFGDLRARSTVPALSAGPPLRFSIRPLPTAGRPESFAGAVGTGFSMDVVANRTVVRVGDPISLTISLRGVGNLENASLPPLSADGGMQAGQFQLPSEQPAGTFDGTTKQFKVNVRVNDESVHQIPALAFSWFDPAQRKYELSRSKPIALQVLPAHVVSARDVIAAPSTNRARSHTHNADRNDRSLATSADATISLQGANLAIEHDVTKLLADQGGLVSGWAVRVGPYIAGVAAILAAVLIRRRAEVDPDILSKKRNLRRCRKQIVDASGQSAREASERIAEALRKMLIDGDFMDRSPANELIKECETLVYAPDSSNLGISIDDLVNRALFVADEMITGGDGD